MKRIKEILHTKRSVTEEHIRLLQQEEKAGIRYTVMMPAIPFLILALVCDAGWLIQFIAGIIYFYSCGFHYALDWFALLPLAGVLVGVNCTIYMNKIHEKEIATRLQKNLSFGLTVYAGLAGGILGCLQLASYTGAPQPLIWMTAGGFINFAAGLPIYLSYKKGIIYGVQ